MEKIIVNGNDLTLEELIKVARGNCLVEISNEAVKKVVQSRDYVENLIKDGKTNELDAFVARMNDLLGNDGAGNCWGDRIKAEAEQNLK